jgi:hypothetical protein
VPTGLPTREVILNVQVKVGERTLSQQRIFRKVVADHKFRPLKADHEVLLYGAKVISDNRIAPREKRRERFRFEVAETGRAEVEVELTYVYRPMVLRPQDITVELGRAERIVY